MLRTCAALLASLLLLAACPLPVFGTPDPTDGGTRDDAGSSTGHLSILVEPSDQGGALVQAIQGASSSVHMTMYLLTASNVMDALIAKKNQGLDVRVVLNESFPSGGNNSSSFARLQGAGVEVHYAPSSFTLTHEKTLVIDGSTAWIMTMNLTVSGMHSNREYLAIDTDAADVAEAEALFEADFADTTAQVNGSLVVSPVNSQSKLVDLISTATTTVDMEAEELSDSNIVGALGQAIARGATVHIVLASNALTPSQQSAANTLKDRGAFLVKVSSPYIHAKSIVVDGSSAYIGSENFSTASLIYNRELGLIFSDPSEVQKVLSTTQSDFAKGTPL